MIKPRCTGTMTESQYLAWIRSALRSKWLRWPPRAEALRAAQTPYVGDNARRKYSYQCAICKRADLSQKDCQVDHFPRDAGSILSVDDIGQFVNRLYCELDNLRVVCVDCHSVHTLAQKKGITFDQAVLEKKVIEYMKRPTAEVVAFLESHEMITTNAVQRKAALTEIFNKEKN